MEADWEIEIGGDTPVIDALWPGFVDLCKSPARISEVAEIRDLPGLADALLRLNGGDSRMWTSKADVFIPDPVDPDEISATKEESAYAIACYLDLLPRGDQLWNQPTEAEHDCKQVCSRLRAIPLRCCRIDLVLRKALSGEMEGLGVTAYLTACGPTPREANEQLERCLDAFVSVMAPIIEVPR